MTPLQNSKGPCVGKVTRLCVCAALGGGVSAYAQTEVLAPPPQEFTVDRYVDPLADPEAEEESLAEQAAARGETALQWFITKFRPHFMYRFLYGTGIQAQPTEDENTIINELYPGVTLGLGDHWRIAYNPVLRFYTDDRFEDTFDQNVRFSGGTVYRSWAFNLGQGYSAISQPLVETGSQTDQERFTTTLGAKWMMNRSLSLDLGLNQSFRFLDGSNNEGALQRDAKTWSTMNWLNYMLVDDFSIGVGAGAGYDEVSVGPDMTFEQLQGRVVWLVQRRLSLSVNGGVEFRQFLDSNVPESVNPVMGASATYRLFESTRLSLSASHTTSPSIFANEINEVSSVEAGVNQRFLGKLHGGARIGFRSSTFSTTENQLAVTREQDSVFFNARLGTALFGKVNVAIFYHRNESESNRGLSDYRSNQVGFEVGYRF